MPKENWKILPKCHQSAENLDIILVCDGSASVGQVGHEVGVKLTNTMPEQARMCCLSAIAAGSKPHIEIAQKAKRLIVINGCANKCASKIIEQKGIKANFEYTISEKDVEKVPTLDFDQEDADRITDEIVKEIKK